MWFEVKCVTRILKIVRNNPHLLFSIKGNAQFLLLCSPKNYRLMFVSEKYLKSTVTEKTNCVLF